MARTKSVDRARTELRLSQALRTDVQRYADERAISFNEACARLLRMALEPKTPESSLTDHVARLTERVGLIESRLAAVEGKLEDRPARPLKR